MRIREGKSRIRDPGKTNRIRNTVMDRVGQIRIIWCGFRSCPGVGAHTDWNASVHYLRIITRPVGRPLWV